jgi:23S rRNA G2069 N7-methylase RlmK/C1962 C5-methylase RlmI
MMFFLGLQVMFGIFQGFVRLTFKLFSFSSLAKVVLKKGKTQIFQDGSPMVYNGAVDRIIGRPPPKSGNVVLVADGTEKPIGWGLYNSVSMFCVRLKQLEEEARSLYNLRQHFTTRRILAAQASILLNFVVSRDPTCALNMERLLEARISSAVDLRRSLCLPSANTNDYRLINSEGDRCVLSLGT